MKQEIFHVLFFDNEQVCLLTLRFAGKLNVKTAGAVKENMTIQHDAGTSVPEWLLRY